MTGAKDDEVVFLEEVLAPIETRLGVELAALDADDLSELLYGFALLDRALEECERDQRDLVPVDQVALTTADWAFLHEIEIAHRIRLVAYHRGADAVLFGGDALDEIGALQASGRLSDPRSPA